MILSGGGYDYDFIETLPDRLICSVCHFPSWDPYLSVCCGHTFCKQCSNATRITIKCCPLCRDNSFPVVQNKQIDREIKSLIILCTNKKRGCKWQGELNDISRHLGNSDGCQFEEVKCSNECGKMIQRQYLTSHVKTKCPRRKVNCQYCHDTGEHQFIEGQHKEECPKFPLFCPNNCQLAVIPRENMKAHRRMCRLEIVKCLNKCGKLLERRYLVSHMEMTCSNRIVECQHCHTQGPHNQITGPLHRKSCPKLPLPCPNKCEVGSVPREDMEAHRKECPLEMIQCEFYSVGCEVRMARKDQEEHQKQNMEKHLQLTKNDAFEAKRQLNLLKDHLCLLNKGLIKSTDAFVESLIINDSTPEIPIIIRMPGFSKLKKAEKVWISSGFTAHLKIQQDTQVFPMKMCVYVYSAGHGQGSRTHLSVYLYIIEGEKMFYKPPQNSFNIKLLSHTSGVDHHTVTFCRRSYFLLERVESWPACYGGNSQFLSLDRLKQNSPFLSNDCLYFQIT